MKKSNRIKGDRLTARQAKQARANRAAVSELSNKEKVLLLALRQGRAVVVKLPDENQEAATCLEIMMGLNAGLTPQTVAQFMVDDALDQARRDLGLMVTYGYSAHEAMTERQEAALKQETKRKGVTR